jgi:hypothetical protein
MSPPFGETTTPTRSEWLSQPNAHHELCGDSVAVLVFDLIALRAIEPVADAARSWNFSEISAQNVPKWTVVPPSTATPSVDDRYSTEELASGDTNSYRTRRCVMAVQQWLVVVALAGTLVGADQPTAGQDKAATVEVTAKRKVMSAPVNIAVGQGFVSGGELFDGQGGAKAGDGFSHCGVISVSVAVPPEVTAHCTSVFRLADGELHLSGMRTYKSIATGFGDATMAITGGTGAYANARGEGKATRPSSATRQDVAYRFVFTISD